MLAFLLFLPSVLHHLHLRIISFYFFIPLLCHSVSPWQADPAWLFEDSDAAPFGQPVTSTAAAAAAAAAVAATAATEAPDKVCAKLETRQSGLAADEQQQQQHCQQGQPRQPGGTAANRSPPVTAAEAGATGATAAVIAVAATAAAAAATEALSSADSHKAAALIAKGPAATAAAAPAYPFLHKQMHTDHTAAVPAPQLVTDAAAPANFGAVWTSQANREAAAAAVATPIAPTALGWVAPAAPATAGGAALGGEAAVTNLESATTVPETKATARHVVYIRHDVKATTEEFHRMGPGGAPFAVSSGGLFCLAQGTKLSCCSTMGLLIAAEKDAPASATASSSATPAARLCQLLLEYPGPLGASDPRTTSALISFFKKAVAFRMPQQQRMCTVQATGLWQLLLLLLKHNGDIAAASQRLLHRSEVQFAVETLEAEMQNEHQQREQGLPNSKSGTCGCGGLGAVGRQLCCGDAAGAANTAGALGLHAHALAVANAAGAESVDVALAGLADTLQAPSASGAALATAAAAAAAVAAAAAACRGGACGVWVAALERLYRALGRAPLPEPTAGKEVLTQTRLLHAFWGA